MIAPGATIGIVGGGQLGRMIALAAARYGLRVHVLAPDADSPAFDVAARTTLASYEDEAALAAFAAAVDVVTYEFENVPRRTAEVIAAARPLHPSARALATTQDRLDEKRFVADLGIPTAPFRGVATGEELADALAAIGRPAVLKTRRFGYDGKGQAVLREEAAAAAFDARAGARLLAEFGNAPCVLEGFVPFSAEISVVAARGRDGAFAAYDPCANEHRDHILARTRVPAPGLAPATARRATEIAARIAAALDYVGVLAVEMFVVGAGEEAEIVVNEIAPRVHNSGHWTIEGAETSQFEQHVRAICGWPLGSAARVGGASVEMLNLVGPETDAWPRYLGEAGTHLHLYGKGTPRPGRKMGHLTRLGPPAG